MGGQCYELNAAVPQSVAASAHKQRTVVYCKLRHALVNDVIACDAARAAGCTGSREGSWLGGSGAGIGSHITAYHHQLRQITNVRNIYAQLSRSESQDKSSLSTVFRATRSCERIIACQNKWTCGVLKASVVVLVDSTRTLINHRDQWQCKFNAEKSKVDQLDNTTYFTAE